MPGMYAQPFSLQDTLTNSEDPGEMPHNDSRTPYISVTTYQKALIFRPVLSWRVGIYIMTPDPRFSDPPPPPCPLKSMIIFC